MPIFEGFLSSLHPFKKTKANKKEKFILDHTISKTVTNLHSRVPMQHKKLMDSNVVDH